MKQIKLLAILLVGVSIALTSCSEDNDCKGNASVNSVKGNVKVATISTSATGHYYYQKEQKGDWIKFSFKEGKIVTSDNWDFAVRGRAFITNGKNGASQEYVFAKNEPKRTKGVKVATILQKFSAVKDASNGLNNNTWFSDLSPYAFTEAERPYFSVSTAILSLPEPNASKDVREAWHTVLYDMGKKGDVEFGLRPIVFLFQTQDGHFAKMTIEKMDRTYNKETKKEDVKYTFKYYYNPKKGSPNLDETK